MQINSINGGGCHCPQHSCKFLIYVQLNLRDMKLLPTKEFPNLIPSLFLDYKFMIVSLIIFTLTIFNLTTDSKLWYVMKIKLKIYAAIAIYFFPLIHRFFHFHF